MKSVSVPRSLYREFVRRSAERRSVETFVSGVGWFPADEDRTFDRWQPAEDDLTLRLESEGLTNNGISRYLGRSGYGVQARLAQLRDRSDRGMA